MTLKNYIRGNKRGKAANKLERNAMTDPFLHETLEGFEQVEGDHIAVINRLEKRFGAKKKKKRIFFLYGSIAAAASVLLVIGFGISFLNEKNVHENNLLAESNYDLSEPKIIEMTENEEITEYDELLAVAENIIIDLEGDIAVMAEYEYSMAMVEDAMVEDAMVEKESEIMVYNEVAAPLSENQYLHEEMAKTSYPARKSISSMEDSSVSTLFGEDEFIEYCRQEAVKKLCEGEENVVVEVTFFINKSGKPSKIVFENYTCEAAKKEMERLLKSTPTWSDRERKVHVKVEWEYKF